MTSIKDEELDKLESALNAVIRITKKPGYWEKFQSIAGVSIDRPAAGILQVLSVRDCRFQELVSFLGVEAPSVSRKVHELENLGLIERKDTSDKRVHELSLNKSGQEVARSIKEARRTILNDVLSSWNEIDRQKLIESFNRLATDMHDHFNVKDNN